MAGPVITPNPDVLVEKTTAMNAQMRFMSDAVPQGVEIATKHKADPSSLTPQDCSNVAKLATGIPSAVESIASIADQMVAMNVYKPKMAQDMKTGMNAIAAQMTETLAGPIQACKLPPMRGPKR